MIDKIILGTVQLGLKYGVNNVGGMPSLSEAFRILNTAYDSKIETLDTAEAYGSSQEVIGKFHQKHPNKQFHVITKISPLEPLLPEEITNRVHENCKKLNSDHLYCYMFHNYQHFIQNKTGYREMVNVKKTGLVKKIGISLYTNEEIEDVITHYPEFDIIQVPFNLMDNARKRESVLLRAKQRGVEIHTRSVFLQGLFFKSTNELPLKLKPLSKYISSIQKIKREMTTEEIALRYALQKPYIDNVLIGVDNARQLEENISMAKKDARVPHSEIDAIDVKEVELLNPSNWNS